MKATPDLTVECVARSSGCGVCQGTGLVYITKTGKELKVPRKCFACGGFLPWQVRMGFETQLHTNSRAQSGAEQEHAPGRRTILTAFRPGSTGPFCVA